MTVCNRSNDIVWGMLGANVVHLTYLHEVVAASVGAQIGRYHVFSNNAHWYANPRYDALLSAVGPQDTYTHHGCSPAPILPAPTTYEQLSAACEKAIATPWQKEYGHPWVDTVYVPARDAYVTRKEGESNNVVNMYIDKIESSDWRLACRQWVARRNTA